MKCTKHVFAALFWILAQMVSNPRAYGASSVQTNNASEPAWSVDDALSWEWASDFQLSPDCRWAAWVKGVPDKEKNEWVGNLFLSSLTEEKEIQLTRSPEGCGSPKWSPDGKLLAFISSRPAPSAKSDTKNTAQLWLINPFGGEPWPLTKGERAVTGFDWAGTNKIIFLAQEEPSLYEQGNKEKKETSQVVEDDAHEPPVRLFETDLEGKKVTRLTENTDRITGLWLSPDGARAITLHHRGLRDTYDQSDKPTTFLVELATGQRKQLFTDASFHIWNVRWQFDSRGFYAMSAYSSNPRYSYPSIIELYHYTIATGDTKKVELDWQNGLSSATIEPTDDGFVTLLANGVRTKAARYSRVGEHWRREWLTGVHVTNLFGMAIGKDSKTLLYDYSTPQHPDQWFRTRLSGANLESPVRLTRLNSSIEKKVLAQSEMVHWKGALGETVEGLLLFPDNYEAGRKYPLVVDIHGGPAWFYSDSWSGFPILNNNLLNARGAFVFRPNYHGSSNYGLKWVESSLGRLNELEVQDIETGVDYLIGRGLVDPEKLGVMGWSQGGVLTAAVTVKTNRYRAAMAGDGVIDWIDYWAKSDIGGWFCGSYLGKTPLQAPELFLRTSSFYQMDKVTTPTLILFGSEDKRVPTEQGWMYYRALQQTAKTDVRFVLFPGDGHGPAKFVHVRRALEEELAWFDKYLFKNTNAKEVGVDLKPDAPLAVALKLRGFKADGVRYGLLKNGRLIPETVRHGDIQIGRFEVTRAQFAEFDKGCSVESGRENFPANGIAFNRAKSYCEWLSKLTGENYRLPGPSECESLYGKSSGSENTLDYWAGATVNPDDAKKLQGRIHELGDHAPLLKEVGSFKASDPDGPVFDLGGNVAEWSVTADGTGKVMGGSADSASDQKISAREPAPEYIGFRVMMAPLVKPSAN
jgi:dipeptidyl aminopeptidase/acylaminoacyl peptidase